MYMKRWGGYNRWTELLDWTTGLTQTAKKDSFNAEREPNGLIYFAKITH